MADLNRIQFKRTSTAGRKPDASILTPGELAINLADRELFTKDESNNVITLSNFRGELPTDANLDNYGPTGKFTGIWSKYASINAQPTHKFPEENAVGVLEVFAGGQFSGTQRYTVRSGNVYVRSLSAKWNGVDGPWGVWRNVQASTRPLSQTIDLDSLGELDHCGLWRNSSSAIASFDRHYPEEGSAAQGFLEVFEGGLYTRTQRYTTRMGIVYTRCLAAAWDAAAPNWGPWQQVGHGTPATFYDGDLNNFKTPGLYNILGTDQVINCPTGEGLPAVIVGLLEVKQRASGGAIFQKFTTAGTGTTTRGRIFERAMTNNIWGAWNEVYTSYSMPITLGIGERAIDLTSMDWQQQEFLSGGIYSVGAKDMTNTPSGMTFADVGVYISVIGRSGNALELSVIPRTSNDKNYHCYNVRSSGAKGSRTFYVRKFATTSTQHTWTAQQDFNTIVNFGGDANVLENKKITLKPGAYIQAPASGSGSNTYANQNTTIAPLYQAIDDSNKNQFAPIVKQKNTVSNITFATGMAIGTSEYKIIAQGDLSANGKADELKQWTFMPSGYFKSPGRVYVGDAFLNTDGNIAGSIWKKYNNATNLDAALNTRVGKGGDTMTGRLTINAPGDAIVLSTTTASNSLHIRGDVGGNNNWYIGKGGADNGLAFYSYATNAAIIITNAGDIALSPKGVEMTHVNNVRFYVHGERWTASQSGGWNDQWGLEAPIFVDHGYVGPDSYYPIIKGRSLITNQGYTTAVDFGLRRVPNAWGQAVIRVGSAENSPAAGHPQAVFEFHHDGTFYCPSNGNFNDVYIRSDDRLKINKEELEYGAAEKVCRLKVYTYDKVKSIKDRSVIKREVGIIAQDLEKELPEAVSKVEVDGSDVLTISNSAVNALLIKAIQEMSEEIKELKTPFFTKIIRKIGKYFKF